MIVIIRVRYVHRESIISSNPQNNNEDLGRCSLVCVQKGEHPFSLTAFRVLKNLDLVEFLNQKCTSWIIVESFS